MSPSPTGSYDLVSSLSGSDRVDVTSDDEVVWLSRRSPSGSSYDSGILSDTDNDDFVVLSRTTPPRGATYTFPEASTSSDDELSSAIIGLSLSAPHRTVRGSGISTFTKASHASPLSEELPKKQKKAMKKKAPKRAKKAEVAQARSTTLQAIDDGRSETNSDGFTSTVAGYEDAASFITSFLSSPESKDSVCKLRLMHALIVELGLSAPSSTLPGSLTAAKAFLKSEAHINIKEYIAVREQGQAALRNVMHPSRSALARDIRKTGNRASLKWVKSRGLQVLLVHCF